MRGRIRPWAAIAVAGLAVALLLLRSAPLAAQTPTPDQLRMYQSLPPEQREAILQQLGVTGGIGGLGNGQGGTTGRAGDNQILVEQPRGALDNAEGDGFVTPGPNQRPVEQPRIKGSEQLLLKLVLPMVEPAAQPETPRANDSRADANRPAPALVPIVRLPDEEHALEELRDRLLRHNPYDLTRTGMLLLPGFAPMSLAGLTQKEVQDRLALDPQLHDFKVTVTILHPTAQGARALKPFGYEIFRDSANAFVPGTDIPVPEDYKLGPGDVMDVQLYGQQVRSYTLPVGRDGSVNFPNLGPISVGGLGFGAARTMLQNRVRQQMLGAEAAVKLSELRSVRVLVLGDAERPGSYVVTALSTVTNALFASGGVKPIGSLRKIEVLREGKVIRRLDLYDVLLHGDTAGDIRLQTGDVVFVPPIGPTVGIDGEIRRPAIYEVAAEKSTGDVIALAGGLTNEADARMATLERIESRQGRTVTSIDLGTADGRGYRVVTGDLISIPTIRPLVENGITLEGHVYRPGTYAFRAGLRLSDVLSSVEELKPRADLHYVLIRREDAATRKVDAVSADLASAMAHRGESADVLLAPRDVITVFDLNAPRERVVSPLLAEMQRQSGPGTPTSVVTVTGLVNAPGRYPLEPGMRVADLLRAGGGLEDASYPTAAELTRYSVADGERRTANLQQIDLAAVLRGDPAADLPLQAYDILTIKTIPEWGRAEQVEIVGEVRFPGKYQARHGETLSSIIERAGGLSTIAFAQGAVFTREELKEHEREQLDRLANRLQADIAVLALQSSQTNPAAQESLSAGQSLLDQLKAAKPVGRLVIDLDRLLHDPSSPDAQLIVRNGDRLVIPRLTQEISVLGEVQNPTSHLYRSGMSRDGAIALSGGVTARADRKRAYVVRADGSVAGSTSKWLGSSDVPLRPGDTVVVPLDAEKMRPLPMWTAITTIIYNLAIAATAIGRL
jgi:protein involved in polysaccharide export with SLBB domain